MTNDRTDDHESASSLEIELQPLEHNILLTTHTRALCRRLGESLETSRASPLYRVSGNASCFAAALRYRFQTGTGNLLKAAALRYQLTR
jgi:hypothetical protein